MVDSMHLKKKLTFNFLILYDYFQVKLIYKTSKRYG